MKVLVLGGTGAMGSYLVPLLSDEGITTFVTSRKDRESKNNIHYIQGDAHDLGFIESVLDEKWDVIVDFMVYSTSIFKNRINLLLDSTNQYIFLSSSRVYADSSEPLTEKSHRLLDVSEDENYLDTDEYALTKARQENVLINSGRTNWTIIRPYITYSDERLQLGVLEKEDWLYRALHGRTIVFSKDIYSKLTTMTHGLDVSKGIKALINNEGALGKSFHITSDKSLRWSEILDIYLTILEKHLGYRPRVLLQDLPSFLKWAPGKYQVLYDRIYDRTFINDKASQSIDMENFTQVENGVKICLQNFLGKTDFKYVNWKSEALKDRLTEEHTPLQEIHSFKQKVKYLVFRYLIK
jgi:nucleoside-diphosphate-sugar epimerase